MAKTNVLPSLIGSSLILSSFLVGCEDNGAAANKSYSSLSTCIFGKSAKGSLEERARALRMLQLSNPSSTPSPDTWPGRCATYANELYKALESSGEQASLKRTMQSKLGCSEEKPACAVNNDTLALFNADIADGAKAAKLNLEPVSGVKEPEVTAQLVLSAADFQPVQKASAQMVGPYLTNEGRVTFLLKATSGRTRPTGCTISSAGDTVECVTASEKMPALPPQSIQLVRDDKSLIATGLTEEGPSAFDLKTGNPVAAKGIGDNLIADGLAVERGEEDKGYVAIPLAKGKAGKAIEIRTKGTITQPMSLGNQIAWLEPGESQSTLLIAKAKGAGLVYEATLTGPFSGAFHACRSGSFQALGTWAGHTGQRGAKPTAGSNQTEVTITLQSDGEWSKPMGAKIAFSRVIDSDLVCQGSTAVLSWVEPAESGIKVGTLTCDKSGCKTSTQAIGNFDARWWWAAGPVGNQILLMWRAGQGEARMRMAPLAELDRAKDVVLFDDDEHGGVKAGEAIPIFTEQAALLLFRQEPPVLLSIGQDGQAKVLTAKP